MCGYYHAMFWNAEVTVSDEALRGFTVHFVSPSDWIGKTKYYTLCKIKHHHILRLQFVRGLQSFFCLVDSATRSNKTLSVKSRIFLYVISYVGLG
jgi:hypothetical protein